MTNLKRIIDEKGVQQRWLAEQVGVTEVSMSRYVNGERIPKAPMAIMMADALGVDVKDLYGWDDEHVVGEPEQPETHEKRTETHACDYIERQAAIDAFERFIHELGIDDEPYNYGEMALSKDNVPSAQPELPQRTGRWIEHNPHKWGLGIVFECSECGEKIDCEPSNYCPNCGAMMKEGDNT